MKKYPLCESVGLNVMTQEYNFVFGRKSLTGLDITEKVERSEVSLIKAEDVESLLEKSIKVNGCKMDKNDEDNWAFDSVYTDASSTHEGLVIGLKEIKLKPVSKEEIQNTLSRSNCWNLTSLLKRILESGVE